MAKGESGRIVIEVDPSLKRELYSALALSGSTLKDWFIRSAEAYCGDVHQPALFGSAVQIPEPEQSHAATHGGVPPVSGRGVR